MQFRKMAAVAGSALMAGMTLAGAAMAATNVGNIASLATPGTDGVANFPIFVIGKTAASADVAGAIDIAVRMAAESKTTTSVTTTSTSAAITGTEKDTIGLSSALNSVLPSTARTIHFSGLKQGTITWKGNTYDYYEDVTLGSTMVMNHDYGTSNINGTEKMVVPSGQYVYEYAFNKVLNMTDGATTAKNTGTLTNPEYSNPIKIKMLGKDFTIVGIGSNQVKLLSGSTGTATKDTASSTGLASTDGAYTAYVTAGVDNTWATIKLLDKAGNTIDTQSINKADSKTFSAAGLDIQVTAVRVSGTDPTTQHIEADLVVGASGTTTKTLSTSCDITSTGSSDTKFPGETKWCMQVGNNKVSGGASFGAVGTAAQGDVIQVIYKPSSTEYYKAGEKVSLPNSYGEVGFEGWNTDSFVTLTASPVTGVTGYNVSNTDQSFGNLNGIKVTADVAGSIVDPVTKTAYTTVYALLNYTYGTIGTAANNTPVMIGLYDPVKQKILLNFTAVPIASFGGATGLGYYKLLTSNSTEAPVGITNYSSKFNYWFNISYGGASTVADQQILNITFAGNATEGIGGSSWLSQFTIGGVGVGQNGNAVSMRWMNKSATWSTTAAPEFRLSTSDSADDNDVQVQTTATDGTTTAQQLIGKATQDVVADTGTIVSNAATNSGSQQVVVKVPGKALAVKAYFGKTGAAATTGGTTTSSTVIPVTTDVVKLDTEVVSADGASVLDTYKTQNLIVVGGPAVNQIAAQLLNVSFPSYGAASGIAQNTAVIKVLQDKYATGKVAILVAGYDAANTDAAALAIQSGKLSGNNKTSVVLTGTDVNSLVIS